MRGPTHGRRAFVKGRDCPSRQGGGCSLREGEDCSSREGRDHLSREGGGHSSREVQEPFIEGGMRLFIKGCSLREG